MNDSIGVAQTLNCGISMYGTVAARATNGCACVHDRFTIWLGSRGPTIVELVWMWACECVRQNMVVPVFTTSQVPNWLGSRENANVEFIRKCVLRYHRGIDYVTSHNSRSNTGKKNLVSSCHLTRTRDFGRRKLQELVIFFNSRGALYRGYV